jgi:Pvc16 N-terminal domain
MSNALAISGVTAVLEYMLTGVYASSGLGTVAISALAPDIVQASMGVGTSSGLQVNLFLHQVSYNQGWRNVGQPSLAADGITRLHNPPLALDLHYLLTAYGSADCEAEALLGFAIQMLHETPVLPRGQIPEGLVSLPATNPVSALLSSSGLADQIEMLKITPATLGREELAWLWTALKADYRPTFPFQVSVVLIEPQFPLPASYPVLTRNITVQPGTPAQLLSVAAPVGQPAPALGNTAIITGQSLSGATLVSLVHQLLGTQYPAFAPTTVTGTSVTFTVPNDPANLPAGLYSLSLLFTDSSGNVVQTSNAIPLGIAPTILTAPAPTVVSNSSGSLVTLSCSPNVLPQQSVALALGTTMVALQTLTVPNVLAFQFPSLASGSYLARLQIDGVDSNYTLNMSATPPFTGPMVTA